MNEPPAGITPELKTTAPVSKLVHVILCDEPSSVNLNMKKPLLGIWDSKMGMPTPQGAEEMQTGPVEGGRVVGEVEEYWAAARAARSARQAVTSCIMDGKDDGMLNIPLAWNVLS